MMWQTRCHFRGGPNVTGTTVEAASEPRLHRDLWVLHRVPDPPSAPPVPSPPPSTPPSFSPPPPAAPPPPVRPTLMELLPDDSILPLGFGAGLLCSMALWLICVAMRRASKEEGEGEASESRSARFMAASPTYVLHDEHVAASLAANASDGLDPTDAVRRSLSFTPAPKGSSRRRVDRSLSFSRSGRKLPIVYTAPDANDAMRAAARDAAPFFDCAATDAARSAGSAGPPPFDPPSEEWVARRAAMNGVAPPNSAPPATTTAPSSGSPSSWSKCRGATAVASCVSSALAHASLPALPRHSVPSAH
jgi:hypothetical protein